jgi:adenosylcobinamide amidohydrolase
MKAAARGDASATTSLLSIVLRDRWLLASFAAPVRACSWAIVGGGLIWARHVGWLEVRDSDLRPPVDPRRLLSDRLRSEGLTATVGLLTSRSVASYADVSVDVAGVRARCLATVGLGNALRAGDPPGVSGRIGTINLLVHVDVSLSDEALLEASAIATEAKCAIVLGARIKSRRTGEPATGTGTDCTVVAAVQNARGARQERYAGKHTAVGAAVGAATADAVELGVRRWLAEAAR